MSSEKFKRLDFVSHRNRFFLLSAVIVFIGMIMLAIFGLNTGVDFSAGTSLDVTISNGSTNNDEARELIMGAVETDEPVITVGGDNNNRVSIRFTNVLEDSERDAVLNAFYDRFGAGDENISHEENTVDPIIAKELVQKAIVAVLLASVGIAIYVSIRFEWRFALAAVIALLHDALIVISIFAIFRLEVNLPFVAAVLTIIGYSINDTIVLFDRIRENMRFAKLKNVDDLAALVNESIRQTLMRAINTSITVVFASVLLQVLGGEAIRLFALAITVGLIAGAYSSIFIASQIWMLLRSRTLNKRRMDSEPAQP